MAPQDGNQLASTGVTQLTPRQRPELVRSRRGGWMVSCAPSARKAVTDVDRLGIGVPIVNRVEAGMTCRAHAAGRTA